MLLAPVISEKSYGLLDENKYTFLVRPDANKTADQDRGREGLRRQGDRRQHAQPPGQAQAHPFRLRPAQRHQARDRQRCARATASTSSGARSPNRAGATRKRTRHGHPQVQADDAGPSRLERRRLRRGHARRAGEVAGPPAAQQGRPQRARPHHHPPPGRRPQARLPRHRLPSPRQGRRAGQGRAHRVRPQPHRAHRAAALRRRREALHRRAEPASSRATPSRTARAPTSSRATPCRCATSRSVPSSTPSSCGPAAARRSPAPPARSVQLVAKDGPYAQLRMPSGEIRNVDVRCRATVGEVGNAEQSQHQLGQGRPHALEGQAPDRPRCRHEPGRPPARWW